MTTLSLATTIFGRIGSRPLITKLRLKFFIGAQISIMFGLWGLVYFNDAFIGEHSSATTLHSIIIGQTKLSVPENMIRHPIARHSGEQDKLDLYFYWPSMEGYSGRNQQAFNDFRMHRNIIFATIKSAHDSISDKAQQSYLRFAKTISRGPEALSIQMLNEETGIKEELMVGHRDESDEKFVALCIGEQEGSFMLAPCRRSIMIGEGLVMSYRFPRELLTEWKLLDQKLIDRAQSFYENRR